MGKKALCPVLCLLLILSAGCVAPLQEKAMAESDYIKWVDLNVPYEVMLAAYEIQVKNKDSGIEYDFADALAYLAVKNGNRFNAKTDIKRLYNLLDELKKGKKTDDFFGTNKYYLYYKEAYHTVFAEYIGEYTTKQGEQKYGLKCYHPIPKGYWYQHSDDFGNSRSFGYKRKHLGHDLFGSMGTPIIAVEGGTVTHLGWNKYGGWRIGIRSHDKKRSYYYAHLRRNKPYIDGLAIGSRIEAGQVIGYLGVTGYSTKENVNMNTKPHLHIGMQLIFNEIQAEGPKEIWVDMYNLCKFLSHNRVNVKKEGNDYVSY
jgi:murein DD-endopeptidase MepM/ murein hydrolase activator NlpD